LITDTYPFSDSIRAFEYASKPRPTSIKVQIELTQ
jgi:D-xylulose reductase